MKKSLFFLLAVVLVVAFTVPASAFENQFGGYFRMRGFIQNNFSGNEDRTQDARQVDTRTRLYYTAVFSDAFKFVNKFEIDSTAGFGSKNGTANLTTGAVSGSDAGGIGADAYSLEVKNSYIDFAVGPTRWTMGTQGATIARGFAFSDDFTGIVARYQPGGTDELLVPFAWIAAVDGGKTVGLDVSEDTDVYFLYPFIPTGVGTFNPYIGLQWPNVGNDDEHIWWVGLDYDISFDPFSVWFTGIYSGGKNGVVAGTNDKIDRQGYLLALGFKGNMDPVGFWVEGFYASGDDDATDDKNKAFSLPAAGASYYWSEIMGYGVFDGQTSNNAPADKISNVYAIGAGVDFGFAEVHKIGLDLWYASLAEKTVVDANGNDVQDLGFEVDLMYSYQILENLKLDLIGAYLFAGKATTEDDPDKKDPWEVGWMTSVSF